MPPPPWDIQPEQVRVSETDTATQAEVDLASAYPVPLGLTSWKRTVSAEGGCFVVVDEMQSREPAIFTINWISPQTWSPDADDSYRLPQDWRLTVPEGVDAQTEPIIQARRFGKNDTTPSWTALRLSNPKPLTHYRLVSVFTHTSAAVAPSELLATWEARA